MTYKTYLLNIERLDLHFDVGCKKPRLNKAERFNELMSSMMVALDSTLEMRRLFLSTPKLSYAIEDLELYNY